MSFNICLTDKLTRSMRSKYIDIELTGSVLAAINTGNYTSAQIKIRDIPAMDNNRILDMRGDITLEFPKKNINSAIELFPELGKLFPKFADAETVTLTRPDLKKTGLHLMPYVAFGILNGGSATSYTDLKKNSQYHPLYFKLVEEGFYRMAAACGGRPKGITPGFIQPDGLMGPSYLELKIRALLIKLEEYQTLTGKRPEQGLPLFQMTNILSDLDIKESVTMFRESPLLRDLLKSTGTSLKDIKTGVQPLIAAFTHVSKGNPRFIFSRAYGKPQEVLALPGGHGQNFRILRQIYEDLYREGKRFVYLTNVDNLGATIDPASVAILALSGKQAGFDFSFKTPFDTKGGILVTDENGRFTCADIGPAISPDQVRDFEISGSQILFNCATGLFDLAYLVKNLDGIVENLPLRLSEQDKEAGLYSQAEQITWEVLGLLDDYYVFAVEKTRRFLPAKLLLDNFMASGIGLDKKKEDSNIIDAATEKFVRALNAGLRDVLRNEYGLRCIDEKWIPTAFS